MKQVIFRIIKRIMSAVSAFRRCALLVLRDLYDVVAFAGRLLFCTAAVVSMVVLVCLGLEGFARKLGAPFDFPTAFDFQFRALDGCIPVVRTALHCFRLVLISCVGMATGIALLPFVPILFAARFVLRGRNNLSRVLDAANQFTDLDHLPRVWLLGEFMLSKKIRERRYEPAIVHMHEDFCRAITDAFTLREKRYIRICLICRTVTLLIACLRDMMGELALSSLASFVPVEIRERIKSLIRIN
jgi:hypothetical protein